MIFAYTYQGIISVGASENKLCHDLLAKQVIDEPVQILCMKIRI